METAVHLVSSDVAALHVLQDAKIDNVQTQVTTEKERVDGILALSTEQLNSLKEVSDAFALGDQSLLGTITLVQTTHNNEMTSEETSRSAADVLLGNRCSTLEGQYNDSSIDSFLAAKQNSITNGDLAISHTANLQSLIDTKQAVITDGSLTIARTNGLQSALNGKQAVITNGDLAISHTANLQSLLDTKQAVITDGSLTIARTNGLQSAIDSKQAVITDGSLTIARTNGLQSAIDAKQPTVGSNDLSIAMTSGLQAAIDAKQPTLTFSAPSTNNSNPSTSAQIKTALDLKSNISAPVFTGDLLPAVDQGATIGSSAKRFDKLYAGSLKLSEHSSGDGLINTHDGQNNIRMLRPLQLQDDVEFETDVIYHKAPQLKTESEPANPTGSGSMIIWNEGSGVLKTKQGNGTDRFICQSNSNNILTIPEVNTTTKLVTSEIQSQNSHLKIVSRDTNDIFFKMNNTETMQLTKSGTEARLTAHGGTGSFRFMNAVQMNSTLNAGAITVDSLIAAGFSYPTSGEDGSAGQFLKTDGNKGLSFASAGGNSENLFESFTEVIVQSQNPWVNYPICECGKFYFCQGDLANETNSYVCMQDYGTQTVGAFFTVYNACDSGYVYVATYNWGINHLASTNQEIYREQLNTQSYDTLHGIPLNSRNCRVCLVDRANGLERWMIMRD